MSSITLESIVMFQEWLAEDIKPGISVFYTANRHRPFDSWEPFYVGTNKEPFYDERLSWEGEKDKMTQVGTINTVTNIYTNSIPVTSHYFTKEE